MATTDRGRERKQQLVDIAAALFAERGYEETRVADIVRAAGVAKGLFYWYFENKEAVFAEVTTDITTRLGRALSEAVDPSVDALTQLRQSTEASVRFWTDNARFFSLLETPELGRPGTPPRPGDQHRRRATVEQMRAIHRTIEQGQAEGTIVEDDPELLTLGVVGTIGLYSFFHRSRVPDTDVEELAAFAGRIVLRMLAATDRSA